jgi:hypothetical protein
LGAGLVERLEAGDEGDERTLGGCLLATIAPLTRKTWPVKAVPSSL